MSELIDAMRERADEFVLLRRDIHRHPELAFDEHRGAARVADKLATRGYTVAQGLGGTGVVATLVHGRGTLGWTHSCGSGKSIARIVSGLKPEVDFAFSGA